MDAELARKNLRFGLAIFGFFLLLFVGTILIALLWLAIAD